VKEYFRTHAYYSRRQDPVLPLTPVGLHQSTLEEAIRLEVFLMQTFQPLMSSINVQESQLSSEEAQRATRLTQLAFMYIPLSFVTGIFGINIKELNGSGLSIWVCLVAVAIVVILTAIIFLAAQCPSSAEVFPKQAANFGGLISEMSLHPNAENASRRHGKQFTQS
jgi:CorA-like Mg2+ transporter protein